MNVLRRLPLNRLLLLLAAVVALGVSATAIASALNSGPVPGAKPLAQAVHDALTAPAVEGVSANIQLSNHLLEGASLATGGGGGGAAGEAASSPLLAGASGRLWISKTGELRLELQAEKGDTQIIYDGHTVSMYDAATNTLYRYTPPAHEASATEHHQATPPTVAKIEEAIADLGKHADVSGATPTDVAGHAAYTVRVSPKETGSLLGGAELSFDAVTGAPLRAAVYSSSTSTPVLELAASSVSYGPVPDSVFAFTPPAGVKIQEVTPPDFSHGAAAAKHAYGDGADAPKLTGHGKGLSTIGVLEAKAAAGAKRSANPLEGLPEVSINGVNASELRTELGTILSFERGGVRYVLAGSVAPGAIEDLARGL